MAILRWCLLCGRSAIDRDSNNLSLFEIIEELTFISEPPVQPTAAVMQTELVMLWARSRADVPENATVRVELVDPSDEPLLTKEVSVDLLEHQRSRIRLKMEAFPISGGGIYTFRISARDEGKWADAGQVLIQVLFQQPANFPL